MDLATGWGQGCEQESNDTSITNNVLPQCRAWLGVMGKRKETGELESRDASGPKESQCDLVPMADVSLAPRAGSLVYVAFLTGRVLTEQRDRALFLLGSFMPTKLSHFIN